jgi:hypothetical protein
VTGDAGIGKSAVLRAAAEKAAAGGIRVLWAVGAEFEGDLCFAGLRQVLHPLLDDSPGSLTSTETRSTSPSASSKGRRRSASGIAQP